MLTLSATQPLCHSRTLLELREQLWCRLPTGVASQTRSPPSTRNVSSQPRGIPAPCILQRTQKRFIGSCFLDCMRERRQKCPGTYTMIDAVPEVEVLAGAVRCHLLPRLGISEQLVHALSASVKIRLCLLAVGVAGRVDLGPAPAPGSGSPGSPRAPHPPLARTHGNPRF
jgi:hypothetical protein